METFSALLAICVDNSPVSGEFPAQSQWCGALMFSLICTWMDNWINNREAGDLRHQCNHYDVTVMRAIGNKFQLNLNQNTSFSLKKNGFENVFYNTFIISFRVQCVKVSFLCGLTWQKNSPWFPGSSGQFVFNTTQREKVLCGVNQYCPSVTHCAVGMWFLLCDFQTNFTGDTLVARFMGPRWDPSGADRTQVGPMLAPWTLLSGYLIALGKCHRTSFGDSHVKDKMIMRLSCL